MERQQHIDGLRAVAVLSVIGYHFVPDAFHGGFAGVDVFFVISGLLITRLILVEIDETRDFSFGRFYLRRIRRLLPALLATLMATLPFAIVLLSAEQLEAFGRSLAATVLSVSNLLFWVETGYFDLDARLKPLLHTWSLSVEEQFYLVWPWLVWLVARAPRRYPPVAMFIIVAAASLVANLVWIFARFDARYESTLFYLTPFRMFELGAGAIAITAAARFSSHRWMNETAMLAGLSLIGAAVFVSPTDTIVPFHRSLLACLGAFLVVVSAQSRVVGRLLSNRLAVGIGLISYSLYLVHWPTMVLFEYYRLGAVAPMDYLWLFAASMVIATLMFAFVEQPFRAKAPAPSRPRPQVRFLSGGITVMVVLVVIGLQIPSSMDRLGWGANTLSADEVKTGKGRRYRPGRGGCTVARLDDRRYCDPDRPMNVLVIGNSHEADGYNMFWLLYGADPNVNLISFGTLNNCDVNISDSGPASTITQHDCRRRVKLLGNADFTSSLDAVVYSANRPFARNKTKYWAVLHHLQRLSPTLPVAVVGGYINTHRPCFELINRLGSFAACKDSRFVSYDPFDEQSEPRLEGPRNVEYLYLDKTRMLCPDGTLASCTVGAYGEPAFYDVHHLSLSFSLHVGERIGEVYGDQLAAIGFPPITMPRSAAALSRTL